jgi:hypothetical protein
MIVDPINVPFEPPDPDILWEHCLETCRRAGVTPVSCERADKPMTERPAAIAAGLVPPTQP